MKPQVYFKKTVKKFGDLIQLFGDENEEIKTLEFDSSLLKFKVFVLLKNLPIKRSFEMHFPHSSS